jgi:hypothetical protein
MSSIDSTNEQVVLDNEVVTTQSTDSSDSLDSEVVNTQSTNSSDPFDNEVVNEILIPPKRLSAAKMVDEFFKKNTTFSDLIESVKNEANTSDETFLKLGDELVSIKKQLENTIKDKGNNTDTTKIKKVFTALKNETANRVKVFDICTINKVVKISENAKITEYRNNKTLPNRWGTLYLLASLSDEAIDNLIVTNNVTSEITRKELSKLVDGVKGKAAKEPAKALSLCDENGNALSDDNKNAIIRALEKHNLHFKIHAGKTLYKLSDFI